MRPISSTMMIKRDTPAVFETLHLEDLQRNGRGLVRPGSSTRPAIWRVEEKGVRAVVKDFSVNRFLFRNIAGRFLIWREAKAYRRLKGLKGVPRLYRVINGIAMVIEEIPGTNLENLEQNLRLPISFFDELSQLVASFHERGLAHCDLKRAPNTLLGEDGHPYIVDWAASISRTEFRFPILRLIYQRFLLDDFMAVVKLKLRHAPDTVSPEERARYAHRGSGEKLIRGIRDRLREILQKTV